MRTISLSSLALALSFTTLPLYATPVARGITLQTIQGEVSKGSYIVKLKDHANKESMISNLQKAVEGGFYLVHDYSAKYFNAFSGKFDPGVIERLTTNENIEWISQDGILRAVGEQYDAPWGLERISHEEPVQAGSNPNNLDYEYDFADNAGEGVSVYVLDTGINTKHEAFEGRASFGYSAIGAEQDGNGHGTHCAGTIMSAMYGVARSAEAVAVKVLNDQGSGSTSDIIAGINWVVGQYRQTGQPAIISMSLSGSPNTALDNAVTAAIRAGVHTVVAAGNNAKDAALYSPARAAKAITVGATTIGDVRASFSNFGRVVDIWAPGQNVISTWIGTSTATKNLSGTSMATPHVAGVLAAYISQFGNMTPEQLTTLILQRADHTSTGLPVIQLPADADSGSTKETSPKIVDGLPLP